MLTKTVFWFLLVFVCFLRHGVTVQITSDEIVELKYINKSVDPCENFYQFTCGNFKNVQPKPDDEEMWDEFIILQNQLEEITKSILTSKPEEKEPISLKKARAAFEACIDHDFADQLNCPEVEILNEAEGWPLISDNNCRKFSWDNVADMVAKYAVSLFLDVQVEPNLIYADMLVVSVNVVEINKGYLPKSGVRPYFSENVDRFLNESLYLTRGINPYVKFVTDIAKILQQQVGSFKSQKLVQEDIEDVMEFIRKIDKISVMDGTLSFKTVEQLQDEIDATIGKDLNLDWLTYFNTIFGKSGVQVQKDTLLMIYNEESLNALLELIKNSSNDLLQNYVMTRLFTILAPDSNRAIRQTYENFRSQMGDKDISRSDYCIRKITGNSDEVSLSMAVTYAYQRHHFNINKLQNASELLHQLTDTFAEMIKSSDWIDGDTQQNALQKLNKMLVLLGYPNFIEDSNLLDDYYSNLRVCTWDHFGNAYRIRAFNQALNLALLKNERDREIWSMSPLLVNAFYNNQNNRIMLPISMINDIFFRGNVKALDFSRIGMVIGHEITHGFDSQGMLYDSDGSISDWWSEKTTEEYNKRTDCFKDQYSKFYISEINQYVNGGLTIQENLADNGGLKESFMAFKQLYHKGLVHQLSSEYTQEQLFFIGYGTMWCTTETDKYLLKLQNTRYPPARFRVNGAVSNNEDFAKAFSCPLGSEMNPKEKCSLW